MTRLAQRLGIWPADWRAGGTPYPDSFWRSLFYFNLYRIAAGVLLLLSGSLFGSTIEFGAYDRRLFVAANVAYIGVGIAFLVMIRSRRLRFNLQLATQVGADILFLTVMIYASGGIQSGLGLLMLPALAAAGLISRGRMALFFASLATTAVLLEETYGVVVFNAPTANYVQAGLLCIGYFATAWVAHTLARYTLASEELARQRGIRLANMARVNQLVIQDMQDGVLVLDGQGRTFQRNSQAERLLGIAPEVETGIALAELLPALGERFRTWCENADTRFDLLRVPATNRLVRTRFVPLPESQEIGAVLFLEDMSRVQAQAQQLKLAALGRLTANIAHEIRNPLSAISHAAELLLEEPELNATQDKLLKIVTDNTRRLDRMVKDVLQLNRRDRANPETFKPGLFLRTFVEEFCHGERVPESAFRVEIATGRTLCFDRGHLNQVLWNLCSNAWRHCRKQDGSIRLRIEDWITRNQVALAVIDDGPGISAGLRAQLFEPFFTTVQSGTGLGLYIAREICDANGAALDCSDSGGGAHFRMVCRRDHVKAQRASDAIRHQ